MRYDGHGGAAAAAPALGHPSPDPGHPCCRCGCASDCKASAWRRRRSPRLREDFVRRGEGERGWGCRSILTAEGGGPRALLRPASSTNPSAARVSGEVGSRELQRCAHEGVRAASHEPDDLVGAALRPVTGLHQALDDSECSTPSSSILRTSDSLNEVCELTASPSCRRLSTVGVDTRGDR